MRMTVQTWKFPQTINGGGEEPAKDEAGRLTGFFTETDGTIPAKKPAD